MKTLNSIAKPILVVLALLVIHSCLDYHVTTVVFPDGSLERTIKVARADSGAFDTGAMRIPSGDGWEITTEWETTYEPEGDTIKKYVLSARKYFKSFKELNEELNQKAGESGYVQIETYLEKKFRWFYTDLRYTETYKQYFPFQYIPLGDYLTENEIEYSKKPDEFIYSLQEKAFVRVSELEIVSELTQKDSLMAEELDKDIEKRYKEWLSRNIWKEFISIIAEPSTEINPEIKESFLERADSIYLSISFYDLAEKITDEGFEELLLQAVADYFNTDAARLLDLNSVSFENFFENLEKIYAPANDSFTNTIVMPGELLFTNADNYELNTCSWEIDFSSFFADDFEMIAESRIKHTWARVISILAGVIGLFAIIYFFRKGNS